MPKTLLIDGEWNLKRNFKKRTELYSYKGEHCGGTFGFLETLGMAINKILPDRVIVMWDGDMSGKMRFDIYPLYKLGHKSWELEDYIKTEKQITDELKSRVSCNNQKLLVKNLIDGLFIRQAEVDLIEGDDLIALYTLTREVDEEIYIYSRDRDYHQLIDDNVFVLNPNHNFQPGNTAPMLFSINNFKKIFGYTHKNSLLLKCIEGDESDNINGIPGVALKTILKYFPTFADEEYNIDRIIEEAVEIYSNKKKSQTMKAIAAIIGSRSLVNLNKILMDLKNPMVNEEAIQEVDTIRHCVLAKENGQIDRSIQDVMHEVVKEGYVRHMWNNDINHFFLPYNRIAVKEKEYTKKILND